ncbi:MAG: S41 family peptidase [Chloroflexia bacterium]|nr:S41 family peptidase [Chloroflexia bacterium]
MNSSGRILLLSLAVVFLVGISFVAGGITGFLYGSSQGIQLPFVGTPEPAETPDTYLAEGTVPEELQEQFELFWQVWSLLEGNFYDPTEIDSRGMVYGAIRGMVDSLGDRYTLFSTPAQADVSRTHLQRDYEGIGAYIDYEDNFPVILGPVNDETPAAEAGLRQGDVVLAVDGMDVEGMPLEEVIAYIKGPAGTDVVLTILREGQAPFEVTITRARIEILSVEGELREDGLAYVQLSVFGEATSEELDERLKELLRQNPTGLILDLRNNGGGYLRAAQEVLGRFVEDGVATYQSDREDNLLPHPVIGGDAEAFDLPMVVLINGGSASASEIVAGALQDFGRATLVGEQSFGKGSIQHVFDLEDGSSLRVTVAHWLTPNERRIQDVGLTPDLVVPLTPEDFEAERDPQLDAAAAYLLGRPLPQGAATPTPTPEALPTPTPLP